MKLIISIVVLLLILSKPLQGETLPIPMDLWNSVPSKERIIWLQGFTSGFLKCYGEMAAVVSNVDSTIITKSMQPLTQLISDFVINEKEIDYQTLTRTITDLYEDPANSFIEVPEMIVIARKKVEGEPTEQLLLDARKRAIEERKLIMELLERKNKQ